VEDVVEDGTVDIVVVGLINGAVDEGEEGEEEGMLEEDCEETLQTLPEAARAKLKILAIRVGFILLFNKFSKIYI
jgi:hypothetical protein